jgi:hypothetical protein
MYSEKELLKEINRLSDEQCGGQPPTQTDMIESGNYSKTTYNNRFNGWKNALLKAGFSKIEIARSEGNPYYNRDFIIDEIKRISQKHCENQAPTLEDFSEQAEISKSVLYNNFETYEKAVKQSGFTNFDFNKGLYSKEEIIKEIQKVSEKHCNGETPTENDIKMYSTISHPTITRYFENYSKAVISAGLEPNYQYNISKEELVSEIKRVSVELDGDRPTRKEFNKIGKYSSSTCSNKFGSWTNALVYSGFQEKYEREREIKNKEIISEINRIFKIIDKEKPSHQDFVEHSYMSCGVFVSRSKSWNDFLEEAGFERNSYGFNPVTGEDHHAWKGGGSLKYGPSYYQNKWEVRERDAEKCVVCGGDNSYYENLGIIDVHHITPSRYWKDSEHEKMNHPRNLICLCRSCHADLEGKFKGRNYEEFKQLARDYLDMDEEAIGQPPVNDNSVFDY